MYYIITNLSHSYYSSLLYIFNLWVARLEQYIIVIIVIIIN